MKKLQNCDFKKFEISKIAKTNQVTGGKKSGPGSYILEDSDGIEMCYDKDRVNRKGDIKKTWNSRPCDCSCE